jgi:hypothetical protein
MLETFMYPSIYPGSGFVDVAARVALVYFVPFAIAFFAGRFILRIRRRRYRPAVAAILVAIAPAALWLLLIYTDMSGKASGNILELPFLGLLAGLLVGLDGRLVRPFLNAATSAWALAVVALGVYLIVPHYVPG